MRTLTNRIGLRPLLAVAAVLALDPSPAGARACDFVDNLVPNCGFDVDLLDWNFTGSSFDQMGDDGASALGCVAVNRHDGVNAMEAFSACVEVTPSTAYAVGASARLASGALTSSCSIQMWEFSDTNCSTFVT